MIVDFGAIAHALHPGLWGILMLISLGATPILFFINVGIDNPPGSMVAPIMTLVGAVFCLAMLIIQ